MQFLIVSGGAVEYYGYARLSSISHGETNEKPDIDI